MTRQTYIFHDTLTSLINYLYITFDSTKLETKVQTLPFHQSRCQPTLTYYVDDSVKECRH